MNSSEYSESYYVTQHYGAKEVAIKRLYLGLLASANLLDGDGKTALDIGAAFGFVVKLLDELDYESGGLELSPYACEQSGLGKQMFQGDVMNPPFDSNSFDLVTMFEVIEHVTPPDVALSHIYRILKPSGVLLMTTPTEFGNTLLGLFDSAHGNLLKSNRSNAEQHQSVFNEKAWGYLLKAVGFTNISVMRYLLIPMVFGNYHVFRNRLIFSNLMIKAVKP